MAVRLKPTSTIILDLGLNKGGSVNQYAVNVCAKYMDEFVPKDTGILRNTTTKTNTQVIYEQPYAHRQYDNQFNNYTTPGTGPYWDRRMLSAKKDKVISEIQDYIEKR